jgi:putative transcriptional regulator
MESLKGSLLIASPGLMDPNFVRTVVIVAEHNEEGALGLVLNRASGVSLSDLWKNIAEEATESDAKAFIGGPVQKNAVLLLHGHEELAGENEPIVPGVYLGSEVELLAELMKRNEAELKGEGEKVRFRVFCGYSGWGAGQLDREMKAGGWLTIPASAEHIFAAPPEKLWGLAMQKVGGEYHLFGFMPPDPEMN